MPHRGVHNRRVRVCEAQSKRWGAQLSQVCALSNLCSTMAQRGSRAVCARVLVCVALSGQWDLFSWSSSDRPASRISSRAMAAAGHGSNLSARRHVRRSTTAVEGRRCVLGLSKYLDVQVCRHAKEFYWKEERSPEWGGALSTMAPSDLINLRGVTPN